MKILVFAGTTEGREISEFLADNGIVVTACVATEYGNMVMPVNDRIEVKTGRLDSKQMAELLSGYSIIIDATHPYAQIVTQNIKAACERSGKEYIRLLRPSMAAEKVVTVPDTAATVRFLNTVEGNVLLTTGSKELEAYTQVIDFENRLFARVLPTSEVVEKCTSLGFKGRNLICMQGPFSHEMNEAMLKQIDAKYMVTKDTGAAGGFEEKISAAEALGVTVVMVARPWSEEGFTLSQLKVELAKRLGIRDEYLRVVTPEKTAQYGRFPLFVDLAGQKVLVLGGGNIATRRVKTLLKFGADITIVSPSLSPELEDMLNKNLFSYGKGIYESDDINSKYLAIAATDDRETNHKVYIDAGELNIPVNVADRREESTFYFPAVFEFEGIIGGLVSKNGSDHKLVKTTAEKIRKLGHGGFNEKNQSWQP